MNKPTVRWFPILTTYEERRKRAGMAVDRGVDWRMLEPHERRAQMNHGGQNLATLASRGGLGPDEILAVLDDRRWHEMPIHEAWDELLRRVDAWSLSQWTIEHPKEMTMAIEKMLQEDEGDQDEVKPIDMRTIAGRHRALVQVAELQVKMLLDLGDMPMLPAEAILALHDSISMLGSLDADLIEEKERSKKKLPVTG